MAEGDSVECPSCGTEVFIPVKTWVLRPKNRNGAHLHIAVYECPKCFEKWRVVEREH